MLGTGIWYLPLKAQPSERMVEEKLPGNHGAEQSVENTRIERTNFTIRWSKIILLAESTVKIKYLDTYFVGKS